MRDPIPVLVLVPGLGLLAFQKDKQTARVAAEYFVNTINVVRWAEGVDEYVPIPEQEAFDIEYWLLEEAKLQRLPQAEGARGPDRARHRRRRRHRPGDGAAAARRGRARRADATSIGRRWTTTCAGAGKAFGADRVRGVVCDVSDEVVGARRRWPTPRASSAASTSWCRTPASRRRRRSTRRRSQTWQRNIDILATGYFLVAREAFRADEAAGPRRLDRLRRQQERARRLARAPPPTARPRPPRCTSRAASPRKARRSASAPTSSTPTP